MPPPSGPVLRLSPHKLSLQPEDEEHYKLHTNPTARVTYGVDHESYAYQLALDMNSAPGLTDMLKRASFTDLRTTLRLLVIWAFGAHFNTKFRVIGPWAWEGAEELLVSDEFWQTITRRPILFGKFQHSVVEISLTAQVIFLSQLSPWRFSGLRVYCFMCSIFWSDCSTEKGRALSCGEDGLGRHRCLERVDFVGSKKPRRCRIEDSEPTDVSAHANALGLCI